MAKQSKKPGILFRPMWSGFNRQLSPMTGSQHVYKIRPRKDKRGVDLISDALTFGRLWYDEPNAASNAVCWANRAGRQAD
jgi:hypothetical protein